MAPPSPALAPSTVTPTIHTYHCLCSTHLLTTPYALSTLHQRASPSLDHARILPLPPVPAISNDEEVDQGREDLTEEQLIVPSLLSVNLKATRKPIVVQREDGWEKRRMWRCGRCGMAIGYEVCADGAEGGVLVLEKRQRVGKVLFLLDGGLVETGRWGFPDDR